VELDRAAASMESGAISIAADEAPAGVFGATVGRRSSVSGLQARTGLGARR
jgi:hypothetical protein